MDVNTRKAFLDLPLTKKCVTSNMYNLHVGKEYLSKKKKIYMCVYVCIPIYKDFTEHYGDEQL